MIGGEDHVVVGSKSANFRHGRKKCTWAEEGQRLVKAIEVHKWYLDPEFSLVQLSNRCGLNSSYASRALNFGIDKSFKTVLNSFRVTHAKKLIEQDNSSLLEIALNSGFGSKASFNRIFLDLTGETPSQCRYQHRCEHGYGYTKPASKEDKNRGP